MSLDAGTVYATLGGRLDPTGFHAYGRAMGTARSQMEAFEKRQATAAQRTSASLHAMGHAAKVGAGAGILGLGAVIVGSVKKAAEFEAQLSKLGSVSNATGKQMADLRKAAMDAGAATKFSALEAAAAQTELAKGGLSVTKILGGGLKGALGLAAAGELDLAEAAATTANALNLFGLNGGQATHVADAMATAANATTADVGHFAMALTQGGAAAKAAGLSFDQTMVALEALASSGVKGSDAGTSLKAALTQLASPSAKAAETAKELGLEFFNAQGVMKPMPQIAEMLGDKLGGLTKQQRLQAATTLVGTDGMRALLALYDAGPGKLTRFGAGLAKQGTAAEVAAKNQDNLKGRLENLQGSVETAAIALGTELLPMFEKLAIRGAEWVNEMVESGQVEDFADGVVEAFRTIGEVLEAAARLGAPVAGVFLDIAGAIADLDSGEIEAILAAIVGFKVVNTVTPMVATLASAIGDLAMNARTAPSLAAFFRSLPVSPLTLAAGAAGALAAALVLLGDAESAEEKFARESAEAHDEQAAAIRNAMAAEVIAAEGALSAEQADLRLAQAKQQLNDAIAEHGRRSPEARQAALAVRQATLDQAAAHDKATAAIRKQRDEARAAVDDAAANVGKAEARLAELERIAQQREASGGNARTDPGWLDAKARAMSELTAFTNEYIQALARQNVSEASRARLMNASSQITKANQLGIAKLIGVMKDIPPKVQARILLQDQNALSRIGILTDSLQAAGKIKVVPKILANTESAQASVLAMRAVLAGVPPRKVITIVQNAKDKKGEIDQLKDAIGQVKPPPQPINIRGNAPSQKAQVDALRGSIDALHDKTITITTRLETVKVGPGRAAGRRSGQGETSLVGEGGGPEWVVDGKTGRGGLVSGPTMMRLEPQDYVIPTESRYRGRALGLLADVAASLGVAYKGGKAGVKIGGQKVTGQQTKKGAWKDLSIPPAIAQGGVPFDRVQSDRDSIHDRYLAAKKRAADLERDRSKTFRELEEARTKTRRLESGPYKGEFANHETRSRLSKEWERLKRQSEAAKAKLPGLERRDKLATEALKAARKTDEKAKNLQTAINLARDAMDTANQRQDAGGYTTAKADRQARISDLINLLRTQLSQVPAGAFPDYVRTIKEQLSQLGGPAALKGVKRGQKPGAVDPADLGGDFGDTGAEEMDEPPEPEALTALTKEEQERLDEFDARAALAELTAPVGDDIAVARGLEAFLADVLGKAEANPAARGGQQAIAEIAGRLKSARDRITDLTRPPEKTADQEAVIAQRDAQIAALTEGNRVQASLLSAMGSPGDIGTGRGGGTAAQVVQHFAMLHPGSPEVLRTIGDAAVSGIGLQPLRTSPRRTLNV